MLPRLRCAGLLAIRPRLFPRACEDDGSENAVNAVRLATAWLFQGFALFWAYLPFHHVGGGRCFSSSLISLSISGLSHTGGRHRSG
jgi:hypothetical protein